MNKSTVALAVAVAFSASAQTPPTNGGAITLGALLKQCDSVSPKTGSPTLEDVRNVASCGSYIGATMDAAITWQNLTKTQTICFPASGISIETAIGAARVHVAREPKAANESARLELLYAFKATFPCK